MRHRWSSINTLIASYRHCWPGRCRSRTERRAFHCFRVRPSRAISGIEQEPKVATICSASARPVVGSGWW